MTSKRLLTICCLLFALASNAAWATTDYHLVPDGAAAVDTDAGHQLPLDSPNDGCNDHCGHASAHFLGLPGLPSVWNISLSSDDYPTSDQQPLSHPLSPLFEPPIL